MFTAIDCTTSTICSLCQRPSPGAQETERPIRKRYYWPYLTADVDAPANKGRYPWETVSVDITIGTAPCLPKRKSLLHGRRGHPFTLGRCLPLPTFTKKDITPVFDIEVFSRYGFPRFPITDKEPQWGMLNHDGRENPVERRNQEIKKVMRLLELKEILPSVGTL